MNLIKKLFRLGLYSSTGKVDWIKTILFNYKCFDFKIAKQLPIFIYNNTDIFALNQVELECNHITRGMIKIGSWQMKSKGNTKLRVEGKLCFHGPCEITGGNCIEVERNGILSIGKYVKLGESSKIMCANNITLEDGVRLGYETTVMDTDYHYILDIPSMTTRKNVGSVKISKYTWISSNCKVMKNVTIPEHCIVVGGSLVNKDYSNVEPNTIFVGTPAKPVRSGARRIYNIKEEKFLNKHFKENGNEDVYCFSDIQDVDSFTDSNLFSINE